MTNTKKIKTVLSGIKPTGNALHIGNYAGAVAPQIELQDSTEHAYYFIADLHALTTIHERDNLEKNIENVVLDYLALGLNPKKAYFFRQSEIKAHSELAVILANFVSLGQMKRMHAYKDFVSKDSDGESLNMGIFNYPILMSADILLYKPDGVPVGEDQKQHVELARDIAENVNRVYKKVVLPLPEPLIGQSKYARLIGTDGENKMSKSKSNIIGIFDEPEIIKKQIMASYTDPSRIRATDPGKVVGNPIFIYHDLLNDNLDEVNDLKERYKLGKVGDVEVKQKLFEAHQRRFAEAIELRKDYTQNLQLVKDILSDGYKQAEKVANATLQEVRDVIGINNKLSL